MKKCAWFLIAFSFLSFNDAVLAQVTAFTYQGQLQNNGSPATGSYDFTFALYTNATAGSALVAPVTNTSVAVTNGLFTTLIDFGNIYTGTSNWLEIGVSLHGSNSFSPLAPRQPLTPVPSAVFASSASNLLGTISAASNFPPILITNLISSLGPLPISKTFTSHGGTLLIFTSGSGYNNSGTIQIGMTVALDGRNIATNKLYDDPAFDHLPFVPLTTVHAGASAGSHTLALTALSGTTTDTNDSFNVMIQELPY